MIYTFFSRVDTVLYNTELLCVVLVMGVWEGREAGVGRTAGDIQPDSDFD